jgi:hypothetical protein
VRVIKLNDIRKFNTGIYDYSVMTSVFASVEQKKNIPRFAAMKVAFTSQEWCGTVFEQTLRKNGAYENSIFNYFESEGTASYRFEHADTVETEENLWIHVRELRGPILEEGRSKPIAVIPSAWSRRKSHTPPAIIPGTLVKGTQRHIRTAIGHKKAVPFTWLLNGKRTLVWVEAKYPHRIMQWEEPDGSTGKILASRREPYWKKNDNKHEYLRGLLKLSDKYPGI